MDEMVPNPGVIADPALAGLPETADDDSYADGERDAIRAADGPMPVALPPDRDDGPLALDDFGTSTGDRGHREPLNDRLARELPDVDGTTVFTEPNPRLADDADPDALDRLEFDTESLDDEPIPPRLGSHISVFDRDEPGIPMSRTVGRLVAPDAGGFVDTEPDEIAYDAGFSGGGFSAEEAAMHEIPPDVLDAQEGESEPYVTDERRGADVRAEPVVRTGADQPWDPEDLAVAEGRDPTPANVERARRELAELGAAAIEKTVP